MRRRSCGSVACWKIAHSAPSSTKNASGERDPQMQQSKKGNQWYFGMKAHIGVADDLGLVHTMRGTSGNVSVVVEANSLLHEHTLFALSNLWMARKTLMGEQA